MVTGTHDHITEQLLIPAWIFVPPIPAIEFMGACPQFIKNFLAQLFDDPGTWESTLCLKFLVNFTELQVAIKQQSKEMDALPRKIRSFQACGTLCVPVDRGFHEISSRNPEIQVIEKNSNLLRVTISRLVSFSKKLG